MKHSIQQGFTLIELMIVIAIIGILAAIAIPQYNDYVAQSQMTSGLSEIAAGKTSYENFVQKGDQPGDFDTAQADVGLQATTDRCTISVNGYDSTGANTGDYAIQCEVDGNPSVDSAQIRISRDTDGNYDCTIANKPSGYSNQYNPEGCS